MSGRASFEGVIRLGRIALPVRLLTAITEEKTNLCMRCITHNAKVGIAHVCSDPAHASQENPAGVLRPDDIGRGYLMPDGTMVPIPGELLNSLPKLESREISVNYVRPVHELAHRQVRSAYLLEPTPGTEGAFNAFAATLSSNHWIAGGVMTMRGHDHSVVFVPSDRGLDLLLLHWPHEMNAPAYVVGAASDEEVAIMHGVMRKLLSTTKKQPEMRDRATEALKALISAQVSSIMRPARRVATQVGRVGARRQLHV